MIISAGPSADGILTDRFNALIVPPENPQALRNAIIEAYENNELRERIAHNGYAYAMQLGDDVQLNKSIVKKIYEDKFSGNM